MSYGYVILLTVVPCPLPSCFRPRSTVKAEPTVTKRGISLSAHPGFLNVTLRKNQEMQRIHQKGNSKMDCLGNPGKGVKCTQDVKEK